MNNEFCNTYPTISDTPFGYTLSLIGGKWKMIILYLLHHHKVVRYNELQLSVQLKELEADGLIIRKEYPQIPPKVEYSLSEKGQSLMPVIDAMCTWGYEHSKKDNKSIVQQQEEEI